MPVVFELKAYGKADQYTAIDQAIRAGQFIRNKCLKLWLDNQAQSRNDLYKHCKVLAHEFPFANNLNSTARQAMSERTWASISRFYENCKKKVPGKKGYPKFKHNSRSVEYKQSGWKLSENRKQITFTDKIGIGKLKLKGTWDLHFYQLKQIKRVRLIKRADGYYVQFLIDTELTQKVEATGHNMGLDVGLKEFYTDSNGNTEPNPRFYRKSEKRLKFYQRRVSRKHKGSANRKRAINKLGRVHLVLKSLAGTSGINVWGDPRRHGLRKPTPPRQFLYLGRPQDQTASTFRKISRQLFGKLRAPREEHALVSGALRNPLLRFGRLCWRSLRPWRIDLRIKNLVKNHCLAKSINDAGWYQFRKAMQRGLGGFPHSLLHQEWLEYFGSKFGRATVAVNPVYTSQNCSNCGTTLKKSLSTRTHVCRCGCELDRDHNAAINILSLALGTVGHTGTLLIERNAMARSTRHAPQTGDSASTDTGANLSRAVGS